MFSEYELDQKESGGYGCDGSNESRHHERVVEYIFPDSGGTGTVKVDGRHYSRVVGNEKVAVDSREHGNHHEGRKSKCKT